MKGLGLKTVVVLALLALAAPFFSAGAAPKAKIKPVPRGPLSARDSLWIRMVTDSGLIILPGTDTALTKNVPEDSLISYEESYLAYLDSVQRARRIADSLLVRQDSIIRAQQRADSLLRARQDSLDRVAATIDELVQKGNDYSELYYFAKAYECFLKAEGLCSDPDYKAAITASRKQCDYARSHTQKIPDLKVVARALFSVDDFFLYYPLPDKSWRPVIGAPAVYYPGTDSEIHLNRDSSLDMIYPMYDGDRMYFASKNLPGFGGYDLYYADWDEKLGEWGEPHNMGFPYNSPYDDFLFMKTEDGLYSVFASTRGLSQDGEDVHVYVIRNSEKTSYRAVNKPKELAQIAELAPNVHDSEAEVRGDALQAQYQQAVDKEQELRLKIENVAPEERPTVQEELNTILAEKTRLEELILSGQSAYGIGENELVTTGVEGSFPFTKKSYGPTIKIIFDE
ncbi:MAG: hypothetical protein J5740_04915 [Bacteroidales bacterium]|nr:hypothetical protein [Bacteroidales bacterium]